MQVRAVPDDPKAETAPAKKPAKAATDEAREDDTGTPAPPAAQRRKRQPKAAKNAAKPAAPDADAVADAPGTSPARDGKRDANINADAPGVGPVHGGKSGAGDAGLGPAALVKGKRGRPGKAASAPSPSQRALGPPVGERKGGKGEEGDFSLPKAAVKGKRGRKRDAPEDPVVKPDPSTEPREASPGAGEPSADVAGQPSADVAVEGGGRGGRAKRRRTTRSATPAAGAGDTAEEMDAGRAAGESAGPPVEGVEGGQPKGVADEGDGVAVVIEMEDAAGQGAAEDRVEMSATAQLEWEVRGLILESVRPGDKADSHKRK
jgi:hypothetical protein